MSGPTVFYSWQSDRPPNVTRGLIRDALDDAAARVVFSLAEPVRIDAATEGVPGTPNIGETLFRKIDDAAVFVADVTFIGRGDEGKWLSNPNVLAETGYAAARLGWDRILLVMNTHFGPPNELPFDLRFRRFPIVFAQAPGTQKAESRRKFAAELHAAIEGCLALDLATAVDALAALDAHGVALLLLHGDRERWGPNVSVSLSGAATPIDLAVARVLQLRLATWRSSDDRPYGFYVWTYLGREAIRLLRKSGAKPFGFPRDGD